MMDNVTTDVISNIYLLLSRKWKSSKHNLLFMKYCGIVQRWIIYTYQAILYNFFYIQLNRGI